MEKAKYLKKYFGKKTSKKKINTGVVGRGLRIIDDNVDINTFNHSDNDDFEDEEEKPIIINSPKKEINDKLTNKNWVEETIFTSKRERHDSSDSNDDLSPERPQPKTNNYFLKISEDDISPKRSKRNASNSDVDLSPPRKEDKTIDDLSFPRKTDIEKNIKIEDTIRDISPPRMKASVSFKPIKRNIKEIEIISKNSNEKQESLKSKKEKKESEEAHKKAFNQKYTEWSRGLKQKEKTQALFENASHEVNKPLARYEDDEDLNEMHKQRLLKEDPMYAFIKNKQETKKETKKRVYKGPQPHPNRFNIEPGYRWDGVDRSNGFEKEYFLHESNKKAIKDIAYKYMTEDM